MNYSITEWKIENMIEDIGEDIAMFHVFIQLGNEPQLPIPIIIPFDKFVERHIVKIALNEYEYIKKIRKMIGGYGPKHSKMLQVLQEEGYDFFPHLSAYITPKMAVEHEEYCNRLAARTPKQQVETETVVKDLESNFDKEAVMKRYEFLEYVDNALHQATLKFYPELFEQDGETIGKYKDALVRATMSFGDKIDELT